MLPPLPSGRTLKLVTCSSSGLLGGTVWPAAQSLCTYLLEHRQSLDMQNVVELGSGTGAVGLFAAGLGANVILTDCCPPPESTIYTTDGTARLPDKGSDKLLELLTQNVQVNKDAFPNNVPKVMELDWTSPSDIERVASLGPFDVVLASDVTHFSLMHEPLTNTISSLLRSDDGVCLLSHQERMVNLRGQDCQLQSFVQVAQSHGLNVADWTCDSLLNRQCEERTDKESQSNDLRMSVVSLKHSDSVTPTLFGIDSLR